MVRVKLVLYTLMGFLGGLAGLLVAARSSSGLSTIGAGFELEAIAAVVIGGTLLTGGSGGLTGTLAGVLLLGVIENLINQVGTLELLPPARGQRGVPDRRGLGSEPLRQARAPQGRKGHVAMVAARPVAKTSTSLSDGRALIYFDDHVGVGHPELDSRELEESSIDPELRFDPLQEEWVIVASHRQERTHLPPLDECPLCPSTPGPRHRDPGSRLRRGRFREPLPITDTIARDHERQRSTRSSRWCGPMRGHLFQQRPRDIFLIPVG